jgi:redox-sensitive bicupin YhaK (pirin superfamily)
VSGPISIEDVPAAPVQDAAKACELEIVEGRRAEVGGFDVRRILPRRVRRTVGSWCFVDHMGPGDVRDGRGLDIGPHPHIGLQTVTWLLDGAVLHRDSLGSEQLIRPGQLNVMTAGGGVSHSEETSGVHTGRLHGIQLWVAMPSPTRNGEAAFEHHDGLPQVDLGNGTATVLVGEVAGTTSPARRDTDHVGAELDLRAGRSVVPLHAQHEYAVVALDGPLTIGPHRLETGQLGYLGLGHDELPIAPDGRARVMLLGGVPFPEPLLMWWNYVARTRDEIIAAHGDWSAGAPRFGKVASPLARIETDGPPWD